ncbi:acetyl-CoA carboxylase biotin carboxylase subunit [Clostridium tertium]|jgi:acetyl-CoA carboxylase, biotin carboxylase subunit|uniref:acetyl-CoA carboxylase biotin carboxylase subunit n=1 Tax=Clostridium TaxID=1485 RepID=UPI0011583AA8|nr:MULTISPECIES: acetyl-CoA carboxylase biotin carboxylase subunit [Clostridium]MBS5305648.1 acetyl-CoA carboxylase biotin carboxylase subunit [Clostridium sp.]MDB1923677.1 acetyl-CoA carboxylase biotin carboxylase subunit [Clostridium tertium]MDB1926009.1 acetyl-CoA carboxylase biotin carboxylase subunit [Clostridium tertium]MDB1929201.1 acetyl-CoA carboxylase biotin carboxylase subunit [Clostridium tertium]MDB1932740.1 acetyl-CoA carboxylase biotin carboxylase subunit [Clostridium tertium]
MIRKVLIANRGEIAVRIIRACKELGIQTVAIYSEADKDAMHTQLADEAICVGKPKSKDSYLNESNIISAAVITKCNAIHPGFGFLSENAEFASICEECNIKFIGPSSKTISIMGDKARAREIMKNADVPVIPGSNGIVKSIEEAYIEAKEIGYPVMIKAALGGGGKGIRIVHKEDELENAYFTAKSEAKVNFGDDTIYIEKFIENPRHIEFQILGDEHENIIHLGERDCTIQRRNQKVLEEAPSSILSDDLRIEMGRAAINAAKAVNYFNAGTIEFLVDKYSNFYFMEMNTRIQVEHPITEMITSIDIVKEQIKIASGECLSFSQDEVEIKGHAIECRINAENPRKGFIPSPGKIEFLNLPGGNGIRVDTAVYSGYTIPPTYDSMIAKLIAYGKSREEAINKMLRALDEFVIEGIDNNIDFQIDILNNEKFRLGDFDTSFISKEYNL